MLHQEQVIDLAERKRLLVVEAELHRNVITLECDQIQDRVSSLLNVRKQLAANPWVVGGTTLAGLIAARHWRQTIRWVPQVFTLWRLFRKRSDR